MPLNEIIAEVIGSPATSPKVKAVFDQITDRFGSEFDALLKVPILDIKKSNGEKLAQAIGKVRSGNILIDPGYDGEFGVVKIDSAKQNLEEVEQEVLF